MAKQSETTENCPFDWLMPFPWWYANTQLVQVYTNALSSGFYTSIKQKGYGLYQHLHIFFQPCKLAQCPHYVASSAELHTEQTKKVHVDTC